MNSNKDEGNGEESDLGEANATSQLSSPFPIPSININTIHFIYLLTSNLSNSSANTIAIYHNIIDSTFSIVDIDIIALIVIIYLIDSITTK